MRYRTSVEDEEDAALSAFNSFCQGVADGRFPLLADRDDRWRLLVVLTVRKAIDQAKRHGAQKRGGGKRVGQPSRPVANEDAQGRRALSTSSPAMSRAPSSLPWSPSSTGSFAMYWGMTRCAGSST
jgi:hypothetical protein